MWLFLVGCGQPSQPLGPAAEYPPPPEVPPPAVGPVVDTVVQDAPASVDVLIAVDPALAPDLAEALPALVDVLVGSGAAWRVGFVSTALGDPATAGILAAEPMTESGGEVPVGSLSDVGPYGGLGAIALALQPGANGTFPNAEALEVVIVTANDDATPGNIITAPEWIAWMDSAWPDAGISVIAPDDASILSGVATTVRGDVEEPFDAPLARIGLYAADLSQEFFLTERPLSALSVVVETEDGQLLSFVEDEDWVYNSSRNSILFLQYIPEPGARIEVTYTPAR